MPVMAAGARTLVRSKVRNGGIYLFVTNFNAIFSISMKTQNTCRWLPALVPGVVLGLVCSLLAIAEVLGAECAECHLPGRARCRRLRLRPGTLRRKLWLGRYASGIADRRGGPDAGHASRGICDLQEVWSHAPDLRRVPHPSLPAGQA